MPVKNAIAVKLFACLLLPVLLWSQNPGNAGTYMVDIQKISVEDGLSSRFINTICKDSRGFMWVATQHGLNRYDGYVFTPYKPKNSTLTSNIVIIHEDKKQKLWLISNNNPLGNLDILDPDTGQIQSFDEVFKDVAPFAGANVVNVHSDPLKNIWISTKKGDIYRYQTQQFELIFSAPEQGEMEIFYADDQRLWLQGKELLKVTIQDTMVKKFPAHKDLISAGVDNSNTLWLFQPEQKKLLQARITDEKLKNIDLRSLALPKEMYNSPDFEYTRNFRLNPADNLLWWFHENNSGYFFVFHPEEGIVLDLQREMKPYLSYGQSRITNIYFDSENRTWVATHDGIFIITLKKNKFTSLLSGVSGNYSVRGIAEDDNGTLYINTYSGRILLHPEKGKTIKNENNAIWQEAAERSQDTLRYSNKDDSVWLGVINDNQGNIWFSAQEEVIEKYNPITGQSQYYLYPMNSVSHLPWSQWSIIRDKTGIIWTGTHRGIYTLNPETQHYRRFTQYGKFPQLGESAVYHLHEDERGIWIAASSGLYILDPRGTITRFATDEPSPYQIPYDHILHFYRDTQGVLWLATKGGGLIRFNTQDGSYQQFTVAEGLSNNIIYAVYEDDYGKLWLPSNYGLMQFDKNTQRVNTYLNGDGIVHNEFNTISHYRDSQGRLYFGSLDGITVFHPKDFASKNTEAVPLQFTRCRVLNGKTGALTDKTMSVTTSGKLTLSPSDRSFIIEYALLNYDNSNQNSYAYKIEGLDKDWTNIKGNNLRVNAMPYGNYTLYIKGRSIKGKWSANELAIPILVKKPFYLENWFIITSILILGLIIYGIFRWRLKSLKQAKIKLQQTVKQRTQEISQQKEKIEQQAEKLKELNATQSRWFTNIAHELRTPLTLILGPIKQFLKKHSKATNIEIESIQLAEKNSISLLKLVNEILDISKLEANQLKINKTPANLTQLIRESAAHFDSFAARKGVVLTTQIPHNIDINIDKERIQKILINLISNALKFTHKNGKVSVSLQNNKGKNINISVADTGDGIPEKDLPHVFKRYYQASHPEQTHQGGAGIGLALSLELARLHGGELSVRSQVGKGSIFTLSLPYRLVIESRKATSVKTLTTPLAFTENRTININNTKNPLKNKPHILLVEDNPDMRRYIQSFMATQYEIKEAPDGLEAVELLNKFTPELIVSDIMMPRMDGITLAKNLKKDNRLKNIPFITLTARADESIKITALRTGIDDYLTKPFNPEELLARAANLIHNYKERKTASAQKDHDQTPPAYQDKAVAAMKTIVMKQLQDSSFTTNVLAEARNMSLSSLKRFLKKTTGLSPGQFIREIRLQHARKLLETKQYATVLEVVYAVGFENASHFAKLFYERFGKKPSEYLQ